MGGKILQKIFMELMTIEEGETFGTVIFLPKVHHQEKLTLCCKFAEGTLLRLE